MNADKNISFDKLRNHLKIPQPSSELSKNNKLLKVVFLVTGNQLLIKYIKYLKF